MDDVRWGLTRLDAVTEPQPNLHAGPYNERYPIDCLVEVADEDALRHFQETCEDRDALDPNQLHFAGLITLVSSVSYDHDGAALYGLRDTGTCIWRDACLRIPGKTPSTREEMNRCFSLDLARIFEADNSLRLIIAGLSVK